MQPEDIAKTASVSDPQLSPDGLHVAYVVDRIDSDKNRYRSQVWVVPTDSSVAPRALTEGVHRDAQPRWSPDGSQIAFTSTRAKDDQGQTRSTLHLLPFGGPGETVRLAEADEGFGDIAWSPDGDRLALTMRVRGDHYEHKEIARRPARKIDHLFFTLNGEGFIIDRPKHVHVIPTDGSAKPKDVTPGSQECSQPSWFPDGSRLAVSVDRFRVDFALDIGIVELALDENPDSSDLPYRLLTDGHGEYGNPTVAPDGSRVVVVGSDDPRVDPQNRHIGLLDPDSVASPQWLTTAVDRTWAAMMADRPPQWTRTSTGELVGSLEDRGNTHLYRVRTDGSDPELIVGGDTSVSGWSCGLIDGNEAIAYAATTATTPAELFLSIGAETRQLTTVTDAFTAGTRPQPAEHFLVQSGDVEVDAWMFRPHDFDPAKKYPTLLNIHGGPFAQYGNYFFDEFQLQAAAGFVVLCSNPRGGSGRDTDWSSAILGPKHEVLPGTGWGGADYDDCMAVVDTAVATYDFIDPDRLGVLGGSYGGYMTSWIVTHTDRFAAACSERAVNNMTALEYGSDMAGAFSKELGPRFIDDPDEYARMSPITYVKDLNTPMLIVHSEDDLRCPADQATQLFVACQLLGKEDVEYWLFPGEDHELSRSGSPFHRKQRAELILEFFARFLQDSPAK